MTRHFIVLYLASFQAFDTGDIGGRGEFYFKCNGNRYPNKGVIKKIFGPEPNPVIYTALTDDNDLKLDIEVWEEDKGRDEKFIDHVLKYNIVTANKPIALKDNKGKCQINLVLKIDESRDW